jgi:DNA-binding beta-propeller fold protein YncE
MVYALDRDGTNTSMVYVFDANTNQYVVSIPVSPDSSVFLAANPNTNKVYVTNAGVASGVSIIDGNTNTVIQTIPTSGYGGEVVVNPNTNTIYVGAGGAIDLIDGSTDSVVGTITPPTSAAFLAVNPNTNTLYALSPNGVLYAYSGTTLTTTSTIGGAPFAGMEVDPKTNLVYVLQYDGTIDVINGNTGAVVRTMQVPGPPPSFPSDLHMTVDPNTGNIYVTEELENKVYLMDPNGNVLQSMTANCPGAVTTLTK